MTRIRASAGPPPSFEDVEESRRLSSLDRDSLLRVRASAEKWRTGLSISSVLAAGIGYFVTATGSLEGIEPVALTWLKVAFAVLIIASVVSIGSSLRAAIGFPVRVKLRTLGSLRRWERRELRLSIGLLRVSVIAATIAVVAAGIAILLLVFGSSESPVVVVTTTNGLQVCGDTGQKQGDYLVVQNGSSTEFVRFSDIWSVDIKASCP